MAETVIHLDGELPIRVLDEKGWAQDAWTDDDGHVGIPSEEGIAMGELKIEPTFYKRQMDEWRIDVIAGALRLCSVSAQGRDDPVATSIAMRIVEALEALEALPTTSEIALGAERRPGRGGGAVTPPIAPIPVDAIERGRRWLPELRRTLAAHGPKEGRP